MNSKIVKGVYIQTVEKKKVVQKYVPTEELELVGGGNLGEFLNTQNEKIKALEKEIERIDNLENIFAETIRGFVTK